MEETTGRPGLESTRITEQTALITAAVPLAACAGAFYLWFRLSSPGMLPAAFLCLSAAVASALAYLHGRVERLACEEKLALESAPKPQGELFGAEAAGLGDRQRALSHFERWFIPVSTFLLACAEAAGAYFLYSTTSVLKDSPVESPAFNFGIILAAGTAAFILMLAGKYSFGFTSSGRRRQLRAPASLCVFTAFFIAFLIAAYLVSYLAVRGDNWRWRNPDPALLWAGAAIFAIMAADHLAGIVLSFYRQPDSAGLRPLYESRIAAFFSCPEDAWEGLNEMLEYQFGVRISSSQMRGYLARYVLPLGVFMAGSLLLLSCVVVVPSGSVCFKERFGKPCGPPLEPGIHFKLPWPVDMAYHAESGTVKSFTVGSASSDEKALSAQLWTSLPQKAELLLTSGASAGEGAGRQDAPGPDSGRPMPVVNLVAARITVLYLVSSPYDFHCRNIDGEKILKSLANHELASYLASHDGLRLVSDGGRGLADSVKENLVSAAEKLSLGVDIKSVALDMIQPPSASETAAAFHRTTIEEQKSSAAVFEAESYAARIVNEARSEAERIIADANAYRYRRVDSAKADSEVFQARFALFRKYGSVYTVLSYLERLQSGLRNPSKIVIATDAEDQVFTFDLKSEMTPELLDMVKPASTEK